MKQSLFYLAIAILAFGVGTFFGIDFYTQKTENKSVSQNEISSKVNLQTESQPTKTINFINFDDLKIKEIGLDSNEKELVRKFGKPEKVKNNGNFYNCTDEYSKTLFFKGLIIDVTQNLETKVYKINEIEITSSKLVLASGIRIGDELEKLFSKFSEPYHQTKDSDVDEFHFMVSNIFDSSNDGGNVTFSFRKNKLIKIRWSYNFC